MDTVVYLLLFVVFILLVFMMYMIFKNKLSIDDVDNDNEIKMKNIINAVNYNDELLLKNQKYLDEVYEENDSFVKDEQEIKTPVSSVAFSNLMSYYGAISDLSV